jgi:hypothetical protein
MDVADQWVREGQNNDWIPFELDDVSLTGLSSGSITPFKPREGVPNEEKIEQVRRDTIQKLQDSNKQLQETVQSLMDRVQLLQGKKRGSFENPLLKKANESAALLWRAPEDNERHDYQPSWDYELNETPDPELAAMAREAAVRVYQRTKVPFELWAVDLNTASHDAVAMYVDGTCGYPVVLVDLEQHRGYEDQFGKSIDHELKHALQESEGREYSEEEAEQD